MISSNDDIIIPKQFIKYAKQIKIKIYPSI